MPNVDRNCLSYWFPRLLDAGVPVPRTEIAYVQDGQNGWSLSDLNDGAPPVAFWPLVWAIRARAAMVGYPAFLRTGQGSGKHQWRETCHLTGPEVVPERIASLVEWSHVVSIMGLPHGVWCVREMLPVEPVAELPGYEGMPLVKEARVFVRGGRIVCAHPYWPVGSIAEGLECDHIDAIDDPAECRRCADAAEGLAAKVDPLNAADEAGWRPLAEQVAAAFAGDGAWSVDLLATRKGWHVTDMAEAARSFHWDGCPEAGCRAVA